MKSLNLSPRVGPIVSRILAVSVWCFVIALSGRAPRALAYSSPFDTNNYDISLVENHSGLVGTWGPVLDEQGQGRWVEYDSAGRVVGDASFPQVSATVMAGWAIVAQADYWQGVAAEYETDYGVGPVTLNGAEYASATACRNTDGSPGVVPEMPASIRRILVPPTALLADPGERPYCVNLVLAATSLSAETLVQVAEEEPNSVLLDGSGAVLAMAHGQNYFAIETAVMTLFDFELSDPEAHELIESQCTDNHLPPEERRGNDYWFEHCDPTYIGYVNMPLQGVAVYAETGAGIVPTFTNESGFYRAPLMFPQAAHALEMYQPSTPVENFSCSPIGGLLDGGASCVISSFWELAISAIEFKILSSYIHNSHYRLRAEIRYDSFNPNDPLPGYFTVTSSDFSAFGDSQEKGRFFNVAVDTASITMNARFMRGPRLAYELEHEGLAASLGDADVVGNETLGEIPVLVGEHSSYEVNPLERNDSLYNQGLLTHISRADLSKTDIYIYNDATGQLLGTRQGILGMNELPAADQIGEAAAIVATTIVRGPNNVADDLSHNNVSRRSGPGLWDWDYVSQDDGDGVGLGVVADSTVVREAIGPTVTGVRMYDGVRIVVINRATGYMGSAAGQVRPGANGMPVIQQKVGEQYSSFFDVDMRPPNLKIAVERRADAGDDGNLVSAQGAGLTSDFALIVTTEWFAEDGTPLPEDLPGFTGRFSRVTDGQLVPDTNGNDAENIGEFAVAPGKHTVVLKLPEEEIDREHFYIHVSGVPPSDVINFANGMMGDDSALGADKWSTDHVFYEVFTEEDGALDTAWQGVEVDPDAVVGLVSRPAAFVPFQVVRFDEGLTAVAAAAQMDAMNDAYEDGDEVPVLEELDVVYRWLYSPEMHFSLFDLDVKAVEVTTGGDGGDPNDPASTGVVVTYDLTGADDANLPGLGEDPGTTPGSGVMWGVGFEQIEAMFGEDTTVEEEDIDDQTDDTAVGDDPLGQVTEEDLIALSLFLDGDEANSLWDMDGLILLLTNPRELTFHTYERADPDGVEPSLQHNSEFLRFVVTRKATVRMGLRPRSGDDDTPVHWLWGHQAIHRDPGEYFAVVTAEDVVGSGFTEEGAPAFEVFIQVKPDSDDPDDADENELLTHTAIFPATFAQAHETERFIDGSLSLARTDLSVPATGPRLEVIRSYSNLVGASSTSPLGIGWSHNFDDSVGGVRLEDDEGESVPGWIAELRSKGVFSRSEFSDDTPKQWQEVIVRGVRFSRSGDGAEVGVDGVGVWVPERGASGRLDDVIDPSDPEHKQYLFTDVSGTRYRYDRPALPVPPDTMEIIAEGEDGSVGGATVHIGDSLLYRIGLPPIQLEPSEAGPPSEEEQAVGDPLSGRLVEISSRNGQRLTLSYDEIHRNQLAAVTDVFGRSLEYAYRECQDEEGIEGGCRTGSAAGQRLASITLVTPELEKAVAFEYDDAGYLEQTGFSGNVETYGYDFEGTGGGSELKNLTRTTIPAADGSHAHTRYAYFPSTPTEPFVCRPDGAQSVFPSDFAVGGVEILRHEVVARTSFPEETAADDEYAEDGQPVVCFGYDRLESGQLERIVGDERGHETHYLLNDYGNVVEVQEPLGRLTRYTWRVDVEPEGAATSSNEIVEEQLVLGAGETRTTQYGYTYDEDGYVMTRTVTGYIEAESPWVETTVFDPDTRLPIQSTDRNGTTETWSYDESGMLRSHSDKAGRTWEWSYALGANGALAQRTMTLLGVGNVATTTYDSFGYPAVEVDHLKCEDESDGSPCEERDESTTLVYDSIGRMTAQTSALGNTTTMVVDDHYSVQSVTTPVLTRCPAGMSADATAHCNTSATTTAAFDPYQRKTSETDPEGLTLTYSLDARGRTRSMTRSSDGATRSYHYDNGGNLVAESDWSGNVIEHTYDALNRRTSTTGRHGETSSQTHDGADRVLSSTDVDGVTTTYLYDVQGRPTATCVGTDCDSPPENGASVVRTEYLEGAEASPHATGVRRTTIRGRGQPDDVRTLSFDGAGRVVATVDGVGRETLVRYGTLGESVEVNDGAGPTTRLARDSKGRTWRTVMTGDDGHGVAERVREFEYDLDGELVSQAGPATAAGGELLATTFERDEWGRAFRTAQETSDESEAKSFIAETGYDFRNAPLWARSPGGATLEIQRDALGRVVGRTNAAGTWTQGFDANGNKTRMTDLGGAIECWVFDSAERMTDHYVGEGADCSEPAGLGSAVHEQFQSLRGSGFAEVVVDGLGRTWNRETDAVGRLRTTSLVGGGTVEYSYTGDGLLHQTIDPLGSVWTQHYDAVGRLVRREHPDELDELFDYVGSTQVQHTGRNGLVSQTHLNDFGEVHQTVEAGITTSTARYDNAGRVVAQTDALGAETGFAYFDRGVLASVTYPEVDAGIPEEHFEYDLAGNPTRVVSPTGAVVVSSFDVLGRRLSDQRFEGTSSEEMISYTYTPRGQVETITLPGAQAGEVHAGRVTTYAYDVHGRLESVEEPAETGHVATTYSYNAVGDLLTVTGSGGLEQQFEYDDLGRLEMHTRFCDAPAETEFSNFNAAGVPLTIVRPNGLSSTVEYDAFGRTLAATYQQPAGYPSDLPWSSAKAWSYVGDELRDVSVTKTWPGGSTTTDTKHFEFSGTRRMLESISQTHNWLESGAPHSESLVLDVSQDDLGNLSCVGAGAGSCDAGGAPLGVGAVTRYDHDALRRVTDVIVGGETTHYDYLLDGRVSGVQYGNGTSSTYGYHDQDVGSGGASDRLFRLVHRDASANTTASYEYQYWKGGRRSSERREVDGSISDFAYSYDPMGRLTQTVESHDGVATTTAYSFGSGYDRLGETVEVGGTLTRNATYVYNTAHQLRSVTDTVSGQVTQYLHDPNGNLISRTVDGDPAQAMAFSYDALDQLVRVTQGASGSESVLGTYDYDVEGARIREWQASSGLQTGPPIGRGRFYFQGRVVEEYGLELDAGMAHNRYRWVGNRLLSKDAGTERGYAQADALGTVAALTDATGEAVASWTTDTWGNHEPSPSNAGELGGLRHGFTGHVSDGATGLVYMRARYYDPEAGIFLTEDRLSGRLEDPRSQHRYLYAHGDPVGNVDPTGLETVFIGQHQSGVFDGVGVTVGAFERRPSYLATDEFKAYEAAFWTWRSYTSFSKPFAEEVPEELKGIVGGMTEGVALVIRLVPGISDETRTDLELMWRSQPPSARFEMALTAVEVGFAAGSAAAGAAKTAAKLARRGGKAAQRNTKAMAKMMGGLESAAKGAKRRGRGIRGSGGQVGGLAGKRGKSTGLDGRSGSRTDDIASSAGQPRQAKPGRTPDGPEGTGRSATSKSPDADAPGSAKPADTPSSTGRSADPAPPPTTSRTPNSPNGSTQKAPSGMCFVGGTEVWTTDGDVAIEELEVGDRVLTLGENSSQPTAVEADWLALSLTMENPDGSDDELKIVVLRPERWLVEAGGLRGPPEDAVGTYVPLELEELGLEGWARVEAVERAPAIEEGPGRVVLATIRHLNGYVRHLRFEGQREVLELTETHKLYSEDREAWVAAGSLEVGESVRTAVGPLTVAENRRLAGVYEVFNLEVESEHAYLTSELGVLSHNTDCGGAGTTGSTSPNGTGNGTGGHIENYRGSPAESAPHSQSSSAPTGAGQTALKGGGRKRPWRDGAYHGKKPEYENPGHHDPSSPNFRGQGSKTTPLPDDADKVYRRAVPDKDNPNAWFGENPDGEFYRYHNSNGKAHWTGREKSDRGLRVPPYIRGRFKSKGRK